VVVGRRRKEICGVFVVFRVKSREGPMAILC
jgi:hypothetical protein